MEYSIALQDPSSKIQVNRIYVFYVFMLTGFGVYHLYAYQLSLGVLVIFMRTYQWSLGVLVVFQSTSRL